MKISSGFQRNLNTILIFIIAAALVEIGLKDCGTPGLIRCKQGQYTVFVSRDEIVSFRSLPDGRTRLEMVGGRIIIVDDAAFSIVSKF